MLLGMYPVGGSNEYSIYAKLLRAIMSACNVFRCLSTFLGYKARIRGAALTFDVTFPLVSNFSSTLRIS